MYYLFSLFFDNYILCWEKQDEKVTSLTNDNNSLKNTIENQNKIISEHERKMNERDEEIENQNMIIMEHERNIADEDNKLLIFQYALGILCGNLFFNILIYIDRFQKYTDTSLITFLPL